MIEFYQLEQFITIAKVGTLSKASEKLLISQPALTRSMQRLEEELEIPLFDHKKNKLTLNENGKLALPMMEKLIKERNQMIETLRAHHRSQSVISIGSCAPAPIWGMREVFHEMFPEMQVTDTLLSSEEQLLDGLKKHAYSIIVLNHPLIDETLECVELFQENLYLSVLPVHDFADKHEISFSDIDGHSVLLLSRIGFWNEICMKMIPRSHLLIQEDPSTFDELTEVSSLPYFKSNITLLQENKNNRKNIPIKDKEAHVTYYAVYYKKQHALFSKLQEKLSQLDWSMTRNQ